jgi:hypothetical protein
MKPFLVTFVIILTHVFTTCPVRAQEIGATGSHPLDRSNTPQFITKGKSLTATELATVQQLSIDTKISRDGGGTSKETGVLVGILVVAAVGAFVYVLVLQAEDASKLTN